MGRKLTAKPEMTEATRQEPRRTFTGCGTCRSRHLKCDEKKPSCSTCTRLNLPCQGYTPRLLWVPASGSLEEGSADKSSEGTSFRYPLYTEEQRLSMSLDMVQSLGAKDAGNILSGLDSESVCDGHVRLVGPFGVFKASRDLECSPFTDRPEQDENLSRNEGKDGDDYDVVAEINGEIDGIIEEVPLDLELEDGMLSFPSDYPTFQIPCEDSSSVVGANPTGPDHWMDTQMDLEFSWNDVPQPLSPATLNMILQTPRSGTPRSSSQRETPVTDRAQPIDAPTELDTINCGSTLPATRSDDEQSSVCGNIAPPSNGQFADGTSVLPPHTADLLRYFKTEVLESPSPLTTRALSPWKLMLLPCALETVGEISLWNTTSCARRSVLSGILAKSAFYLSRKTRTDQEKSSFWYKVGSDHRFEAQKQLRVALTSELGGNVEYEEMLMAILCVGVVSFYYPGPQFLWKLLLDAERLIRWRGLPAKKTFRYRVLHHLYTHLRLILESTNVSPKLPGQEADQEPGPSPNQLESCLPRKFGLDPKDLGDLDSERQKPESIGYNDIHLDVSGTWHVTLYPDMFGVPESLMTLLSQTISLVNEKPRLEASAMSDPPMSKDLALHIKILEQQIWSWCLPSGPRLAACMVHADSAVHDRPLMENMILAMHQALIIFFYRRVYNISIMIVQDQVKKVLDLVMPYSGTAIMDSDFSVSIGWSVFIAVCDAATPELQRLGLQCLEAFDDCGMFVKKGKPSTTAKAVWEERRQRKNFTFGWPDLIKLE